jgi:hypothetical protein
MLTTDRPTVIGKAKGPGVVSVRCPFCAKPHYHAVAGQQRAHCGGGE